MTHTINDLTGLETIDLERLSTEELATKLAPFVPKARAAVPFRISSAGKQVKTVDHAALTNTKIDASMKMIEEMKKGFV